MAKKKSDDPLYIEFDPEGGETPQVKPPEGMDPQRELNIALQMAPRAEQPAPQPGAKPYDPSYIEFKLDEGGDRIKEQQKKAGMDAVAPTLFKLPTPGAPLPGLTPEEKDLVSTNEALENFSLIMETVEKMGEQRYTNVRQQANLLLHQDKRAFFHLVAQVQSKKPEDMNPEDHAILQEFYANMGSEDPEKVLQRKMFDMLAGATELGMNSFFGIAQAVDAPIRALVRFPANVVGEAIGNVMAPQGKRLLGGRYVPSEGRGNILADILSSSWEESGKGFAQQLEERGIPFAAAFPVAMLAEIGGLRQMGIGIRAQKVAPKIRTAIEKRVAGAGLGETQAGTFRPTPIKEVSDLTAGKLEPPPATYGPKQPSPLQPWETITPGGPSIADRALSEKAMRDIAGERALQGMAAKGGIGYPGVQTEIGLTYRPWLTGPKTAISPLKINFTRMFDFLESLPYIKGAAKAARGVAKTAGAILEKAGRAPGFSALRVIDEMLGKQYGAETVANFVKATSSLRFRFGDALKDLNEHQINRIGMNWENISLAEKGYEEGTRALMRTAITEKELEAAHVWGQIMDAYQNTMATAGLPADVAKVFIEGQTRSIDTRIAGTEARIAKAETKIKGKEMEAKAHEKLAEKLTGQLKPFESVISKTLGATREKILGGYKKMLAKQRRLEPEKQPILDAKQMEDVASVMGVNAKEVAGGQTAPSPMFSPSSLGLEYPLTQATRKALEKAAAEAPDEAFKESIGLILRGEQQFLTEIAARSKNLTTKIEDMARWRGLKMEDLTEAQKAGFARQILRSEDAEAAKSLVYGGRPKETKPTTRKLSSEADDKLSSRIDDIEADYGAERTDVPIVASDFLVDIWEHFPGSVAGKKARNLIRRMYDDVLDEFDDTPAGIREAIENEAVERAGPASRHTAILRDPATNEPKYSWRKEGLTEKEGTVSWRSGIRRSKNLLKSEEAPTGKQLASFEGALGRSEMAAESELDAQLLSLRMEHGIPEYRFQKGKPPSPEKTSPESRFEVTYDEPAIDISQQTMDESLKRYQWLDDAIKRAESMSERELTDVAQKSLTLQELGTVKTAKKAIETLKKDRAIALREAENAHKGAAGARDSKRFAALLSGLEELKASKKFNEDLGYSPRITPQGQPGSVAAPEKGGAYNIPSVMKFSGRTMPRTWVEKSGKIKTQAAIEADLRNVVAEYRANKANGLSGQELIPTSIRKGKDLAETIKKAFGEKLSTVDPENATIRALEKASQYLTGDIKDYVRTPLLVSKVFETNPPLVMEKVIHDIFNDTRLAEVASGMRMIASDVQAGAHQVSGKNMGSELIARMYPDKFFSQGTKDALDAWNKNVLSLNQATRTSAAMNVLDVAYAPWKYAVTYAMPQYGLKQVFDDLFRGFTEGWYNPVRALADGWKAIYRPRSTVKIGKETMPAKDLADIASAFGAVQTQIAADLGPAIGRTLGRKIGGKIPDLWWHSGMDRARRIGHFAERLRQGMSFAEAAASTLRAFLDYQNISSWERASVAHLIPFYRFGRQNLPFQIGKIFSQPAWANAQLKLTGFGPESLRNQEDRDLAWLPPPLRHAGAITYRDNEVVKVLTAYGYSSVTQLADLVDRIDAIKDLPSGEYAQAVVKFVKGLGPLPQAIADAAAGRYSGKMEEMEDWQKKVFPESWGEWNIRGTTEHPRAVREMPAWKKTITQWASFDTVLRKLVSPPNVHRLNDVLNPEHRIRTAVTLASGIVAEKVPMEEMAASFFSDNFAEWRGAAHSRGYLDENGRLRKRVMMDNPKFYGWYNLFEKMSRDANEAKERIEYMRESAIMGQSGPKKPQ